MSAQVYDCIVIGGGPAGLSAALFLARYRRKVLTFHNNSPRNLYSHGVHGFLGHHGILPADLLARGREEVTQHGGLLIEGCVTRAERLGDDHFRVATGGGQVVEQSFEARRVLLATGLRDFTPDCPGFHEFYGRSVHHCPDCDGFEHTGQRIAVMGHGGKAIPFLFRLLTWSEQLTLITNDKTEKLTDVDRDQLRDMGVLIIEKSIAGLEGDIQKGKLERVRFADNDVLEADALFFSLGTEPASDLHVQLGCRIDEACHLVAVDSQQQTSVPGVYAAGDITPNSQLAVVAAAEGAMAAIQIHLSLQQPHRRWTP